MRIVIVAAMARNRVIGRDGGLPWHLPADLRAFKAATLGKPVIMGRRTWESIGRPLPGRLNIVVSRSAGYRADGAVVCTSLEAALGQARTAGAEAAMIIGGAQLYREALPLADEMLLTLVDAEPEGDTRFPDFDAARWQEISRSHHPADERNCYAMDTVRLVSADVQ